MKKILNFFINKNSFSNNYKRIWPYVKPYKWRALWAMLITIPVGLMDAWISLSLKSYIDAITSHQLSTYALLLPGLVIIIGFLQGAFNYASLYLNTWVGRKISNDVKLVLFDHLISCDSRFFDKNTSGFVQFRFNQDVDTACNGLLNNLKLFITRVISSVSLIGVLIYNSWRLAIVATLIMVLALLPLTQIRKKLKTLTNQSAFSTASIATYYNEVFHGNRIVSSYNLKQYQKNRFSQALNEIFRLGIKITQKTGVISPIMQFIVAIGIAFSLWYGTYLITSSQMTAGNFVSFLTALLMLYTPIKNLGNNLNAVQMAFMAMERIWELLDSKPEIIIKDNATDLLDIKSTIEYKNVNFQYTTGVPVLKDINLTIKSGETIALVGNSGGGKSTFANLLPRFYDVSSGAILIDGVDIKDVTLASLRSKIAIVFQDNFLFTGSIRDNIILDNSNISAEKINAAIKNACLDEFINSLESGLDTEIGERGILLSGGQRQRVAIARAFIKNSPIVILDEATSALDNKSETIVQKAISNLMKNRTVLVIAHRLSTIRHADRIIVINHGQIIEQGKHEELLLKQGAYAALYGAGATT